MKTHILLIGEQNLPNLLPLRFYRPDQVIAVYSDRTEDTCDRLCNLVKDEVALNRIPIHNAFDISSIHQEIRTAVKDLEPASTTFNFTGGTKPMSLAAYLVAAELNAPMIYIQSEGKATRCYEYRFEHGTPSLTGISTIPEVITIDDYLRVHTGQGFHPRKTQTNDVGHQFEQVLFDALKDATDEIVEAASLDDTVDIDLMVRCGNLVAVIEAKTGLNGVKKAIDQLSVIGEQRYLGTYTVKILVSDQDLTAKSNLMKLAKAQRITVIELQEYGRTKRLNQEETRKLQEKVTSLLRNR